MTKEPSRQLLIQTHIDKITSAFGRNDAELEAKTRREIVSYTSARFDSVSTSGDVPENMQAYLDKVALHAYKITDADVGKLKDAAYTEAEIYELTVGGCLGVGLTAWKQGIDAIDTFFDKEVIDAT